MKVRSDMKYKLKTTSVSGLRIIPNFLTEEEERNLIRNFDREEWEQNQSRTRRVIFYGKKHTYRTYEVSENAYIRSFPDYSLNIKRKAERILGKFGREVEYNDYDSELYVNEYHRHDNLYFHTDHRATYEELIIGISLEADCYFSFKDTKTGEIKSVFVPRRSMYLMEGYSRYNAQHGILQGGILGERRISLTFRKIKRLR